MAIDIDAALMAFNTAGIDLEEDFYALPSSKVDVIVELAKIQSYRKPANANGSTARYYFEAVKRKNRKS